ncbi:MAG: hypothetical protein GC190_12170 [Alphaproteobacteria bacterium]|nr:hypothetical protein [Alphaproteobacteria bacterium]
MTPKLFLVPAMAAAMLMCTACDKRPDQAAQNDANPMNSSTEMGSSAPTSAKFSADDMAKGQVATDVADPQTTLASASVENQQGESLGQIKSITVGGDGKAQAVNIEVASVTGMANKTVAVDASKFTYLPDQNVLVASLAKSDLDSMPEAPVQQ